MMKNITKTLFAIFIFIFLYGYLNKSTNVGSYKAVFYYRGHSINDSLPNSNIKMILCDSLGNHYQTYGKVLDSLITGRTYLITITIRSFYQVKKYIYLNNNSFIDTIFLEKIPMGKSKHYRHNNE